MTTKKKVFIILVLAVSAVFLMVAIKKFNAPKRLVKLFEPPKGNTIQKNTTEPVLDSFSFNPEVQNKSVDSFQHFNVRINNLKKLGIKLNEIELTGTNEPLLITIETWGSRGITSYYNNPLIDIANGKYDEIFKALSAAFAENRHNIWFRLNPDMEVPVNRYPWQQIGGPAYIEAFRHFVSVCKMVSPQIKFVWGPAGYPGTLEFYPGDDVVDAVSVTIKSESESPLDVYPKDYTLEYDIFRRLHRLRFTDKPVFILGSGEVKKESVNQELILSVTQKINLENEIIYSPENFKRPAAKVKPDSNQKFEIGIFDEFERLNDEEPVTVEHLFADFRKLKDGTFQKEFKNVINRNHDIIVTFEPFYGPNEKNDLEVLQNVLDGKYDSEIEQFYSIILSTDRIVYLRYAHEMEIPITRYPWQSQDPVTYIKSYRYFMTFRQSLPPTVKRVWGPAGDRGSLEFWPGNDLVDFVSIAIYGLPDKNITDPEMQESFEKIFTRKYWRLRFIDKPLFITEFGVKGPEDYQTKWLEDAARIIRENPQIKGINYFNMSDTPKAWGEIKPPDWSITKNTFYRFIEVLNEY